LPSEQKISLLEIACEKLRAVDDNQASYRDTKYGISAEQANKLRDQLSLSKWTSLAHLVSYSRTMAGELRQEERLLDFSALFQGNFDSNLFKSVLSEDNDVKASRLDRDIARQSSSFYRAFVELVSNAYDASRDIEGQIGRFGMGFFQALNHLRSEEDLVRVTSRKVGQESSNAVEIASVHDQPCLRSFECELDQEGTWVEVKGKHIKQELVEKILIETFQRTQGIQLMLNGSRINSWHPDNASDAEYNQEPLIEIVCRDEYFSVRDYGRGMSDAEIVQNLLTPKLSSKPPVYTLSQEDKAPKIWYETTKDISHTKGLVEIQVGGVKIESYPINATNACVALVIDLPSFTFLTEERDKIEVNKSTAESLKLAFDRLSDIDATERSKIINSLVDLAKELQGRNLSDDRSHHLSMYLQAKTREFTKGEMFLPNEQQFAALKCADAAIFLDPRLVQCDYHAMDYFTFVGQLYGLSFYSADFKEGQPVSFLRDGTKFILDRRLFNTEHPEAVVAMIELATGVKLPLEFFGKEEFVDDSSLAHLELMELAESQWKVWGFKSKELAQAVCLSFSRNDPRLYAMFRDQVAPIASAKTYRHLWSSLNEPALTHRSEGEDSIVTNVSLLGALLAHPITKELVERHDVSVLAAFCPITSYLPSHLTDNESKSLVDANGDNVFYTLRNPEVKGSYIDTKGRYYKELPTQVKRKDGDLWFKDVKENLFPIVDRSPRSFIPFCVEAKGAKATFRITESGLMVGEETAAFQQLATETVPVLLALENGAVRIIAYNSPPDANHYKDVLAGSEVRILGEDGEIIWRLDAGSGLGEQEEATARVINNASAVSLDHPAIELFRVEAESWEVVRRIGSFVTAGGQQVEIADTTSVNTTTILAKYSYEIKGDTGDFETPLIGSDDYVPEHPELGILMLQARPIYDAISDTYLGFATWKSWLASDDMVSAGIVTFNSEGNPVLKQEVHTGPLEEIMSYVNERVSAGKHINPYGAWLDPRKAIAGMLSMRGEQDRETGQFEVVVPRIIIRDSLLSPQVFAQGDIHVEQFLDLVRVDGSKERVAKLGRLSDAIAEFLLTESVLEREKMSRMFVRLVNLSDLDDKTLATLIPVLYEIDDLSLNFQKPDIIRSFEAVLNLSPERLISFVSLIHRCLPIDEARAIELVDRAVGYYNQRLRQEPLSETDLIVKKLAEVHNYEDENYYCDGYTIIREGLKVGIHKLDQRLTQLIMFLDANPESYVRHGEIPVVLPSTEPVRLRLSQLMHWKRTRDSEALAFAGNAEELGRLVTDATEQKAIEHLQREITHAIHHLHQGRDEITLREMLQNNLDAIESFPDSNVSRDVLVDFCVLSGSTYAITLEDRVGMNGSTVFNFVLPLGESTKLDGKSVGWLGQGFYSLLSHSAVLKTGKGDGKVWYLSFNPVKSNGMVLDHEIDIWCVDENFSGTLTSKTKSSKSPVTDAIIARDSLTSMAGLVDAKRMKILAHGAVINPELDCIYSEEITDQGVLRFYRHRSNMLTQHGFGIKPLQRSDYRGSPDLLLNIIFDEIGIVEDVPSRFPLTGSRMEIASRELLPAQYEEARMRGLVRMLTNSIDYLQYSKRQWFPYRYIPYDYFTNPSLISIPSVRRDAGMLAQGGAIQDHSIYEDKEKLFLLLAELPIFDVNGEVMSLAAIKEAYIAGDRKIQPHFLPGPLATIITELEREKAKAAAFKSMLELIPDHSKKVRQKPVSLEPFFWEGDTLTGDEAMDSWIERERAGIDCLDRLNKSFYFHAKKAGILPNDVTVEAMIASKDNNAIAWNQKRVLNSGVGLHTVSNIVVWNLGIMNQSGGSLSALNKLSDSNTGALFILDVLVEEYAHACDEPGDWTHNSLFNVRKAKLMSAMIATGWYAHLLAVISEYQSNRELHRV
jgi:hypothetical protein